MARLTHPTAGTVVHVEGDIEIAYRESGWVDVEEQTEKPKRGRSAKK